MKSAFDLSFTKDLIKFCLSSQQGPKRYHITRLYMYTHLQDFLVKQDSKFKQCLAISGSSGLAKILGLKSVQIQSAHYPECNLINLKFQDNSFDFCLSDQVLEHVQGNPYKAFEESIRVVKPGGFIIHTTCFINEVHHFPGDFWRFTPDALRLMSESFGTEVMTCGGWGNREVWSYIDMGYRGAKIPEDPHNPIYQLAMKNDPSCPIVTWVVAQVK